MTKSKLLPVGVGAGILLLSAGVVSLAQDNTTELAKVRAKSTKAQANKRDLLPNPACPALDDCSGAKPPKILNQYVITTGIVPTSITANNAAFAAKIAASANWTLSGTTPPLLPRDPNSLVGSVVTPVHTETYAPSPPSGPNPQPLPLPPVPGIVGLQFSLRTQANSSSDSNIGWVFPSSNADFGVKTLTHKFLGESVPVDVALFYPSTGTQHPTGGPPGYDSLTGWTSVSTPNWLYYYDQVWKNPWGVPIYYYPGGTSKFVEAPVAAYQADYIWISDDAFGTKSTNTYLFGRVRATNGTLGPLQIVGWRQLKGIDTYAAVVSHEATHKQCWDYINNGSYADVDRDNVPDDWEAQCGLIVGRQDSTGFLTHPTVAGELDTSVYDASDGDDEAFARMHERVVNPDIDQDWANDGLNFGRPPTTVAAIPSRCRRFVDFNEPGTGAKLDLSNVEWPSLP